eukprot:gene5449-6131_t
MAKSANYDNNKIILISASVVGGIVGLMTIILLILLLRRRVKEKAEEKKRKKQARFASSKAENESQNARQRRFKFASNGSNASAGDLITEEGEIQGEMEINEVASGDRLRSSSLTTASVQSENYHINLHEVDFSNNVINQEEKKQQQHTTENDKVVNVVVHAKSKLTNIREEELSDSDYDATFETTTDLHDTQSQFDI